MRTALSVARIAAGATAVITLVTFALALMAIPISGANCPGNCISYPYLETTAQFPRDYLWMIGAIVLMPTYVVLMVAIDAVTGSEQRIFSRIACAFGLLAAGVLLITYFTQFAVVPVSLMHGETQGIALVTQYNPHGLFIALEELGYLLMSLSFLFLAPIFCGDRLNMTVRWIFAGGSVLVFVALAFITARYGLDRQDRFEVVAISAVWLVLIVNGFLLGRLFQRRRLEMSSHAGQEASPISTGSS